MKHIMLQAADVPLLDERLECFTALTGAVQKFTQQSGNAEVRTIGHFLADRAVLRVPLPGASLGYYSAKPLSMK